MPLGRGLSSSQRVPNAEQSELRAVRVRNSRCVRCCCRERAADPALSAQRRNPTSKPLRLRCPAPGPRAVPGMGTRAPAVMMSSAIPIPPPGDNIPTFVFSRGVMTPAGAFPVREPKIALRIWLPSVLVALPGSCVSLGSKHPNSGRGRGGTSRKPFPLQFWCVWMEENPS